jgi:solute:Na+ symporter, SSS family
LVMNGLVKIPMQFLILLIGSLVFAFYQYNAPPVFFNQTEVTRLQNSNNYIEFQELEKSHAEIHKQKREHVDALITGLHSENEEQIRSAQKNLLEVDKQTNKIRTAVTDLMKENNPEADTNDTNYIFLRFVTTWLPQGLIGLLIAIILLASMGSTASGMNSLASTTVVDFYKRFAQTDGSEKHYLAASRWATVGWGLFCVIVALFASKLGNLIEAVNILGSLFYGTILGIFLVAFYMKTVKGQAVFYAAIIAEIFVVIAWLMDLTAFLWLNAIGCLLVMGIAWTLQRLLPVSVGKSNY